MICTKSTTYRDSKFDRKNTMICTKSTTSKAKALFVLFLRMSTATACSLKKDDAMFENFPHYQSNQKDFPEKGISGLTKAAAKKLFDVNELFLATTGKGNLRVIYNDLSGWTEYELDEEDAIAMNAKVFYKHPDGRLVYKRPVHWKCRSGAQGMFGWFGGYQQTGWGESPTWVHNYKTWQFAGNNPDKVKKYLNQNAISDLCSHAVCRESGGNPQYLKAVGQVCGRKYCKDGSATVTTCEGTIEFDPSRADQTRRRLTNQRLIDRFIRESIRCEQS